MPPHTTRPPFFTAARAAGTSAPTGAKIIAASSGSGGISSEPPAHTAPSERAKSLRRRIAGPGESIDAPPLPGRDLRQNVGGGAEAIKSERFALAGHAVAAPADQAGAKQRRRLRGVEDSSGSG